MSDDRKRDSHDDQRSRPERHYYSRPKFCQFCADKNLTIDYKKVDMLKRLITEDGKSALAAKPAPVPDISVPWLWPLNRLATLRSCPSSASSGKTDCLNSKSKGHGTAHAL